jgi:hypothetical protein
MLTGQEAQPRVKRRRLSASEAAGSAVQQSLDAWNEARLIATTPGSDAPRASRPSASGGIDGTTLVGRAVEGTIESCTPAGYMVELRTGMHVMRGALIRAFAASKTCTIFRKLTRPWSQDHEAGLGWSYRRHSDESIRA